MFRPSVCFNLRFKVSVFLNLFSFRSLHAWSLVCYFPKESLSTGWTPMPFSKTAFIWEELSSLMLGVLRPAQSRLLGPLFLIIFTSFTTLLISALAPPMTAADWYILRAFALLAALPLLGVNVLSDLTVTGLMSYFSDFSWASWCGFWRDMGLSRNSPWKVLV